MWVKYARSGASRATTSSASRQAEVRRVRPFAQRVEDERPARRRAAATTRRECGCSRSGTRTPDAESEDRQLAVKERDRNDLDAAERERSGDREEPQLRDAAAVLPRPGEDVREDPPQIGLGLRARRSRRSASRCIPLNGARLVEAEHVIGVAVREQDRVDAPDVVGERLRAQVGRRVDENRTDRPGERRLRALPSAAR